jgi:putative drug exporter of the RND superfamily
MVAVFSIFATLSLIEFKMFGVAMAAAVLIDATIVRGVLLPAGLALLGDRAWPRKARRAVRGDAAQAAAAPVISGAAIR